MHRLRENPVVVLGALVLAGAVALSAATLTTAPYLFGDEAWFASTAWSASSGRGWEPAIMQGAGVYENAPDYWASRIGSLPHVVGEVVFPTTLTLHRGVSLLVGLVALGLFGWAMYRRHGLGLALLAAGMLMLTWGFYSSTHWVRWDAMALLFCCALLLILIDGPPRPLAAAGAGALIGISPDFGLAVAGTFPAVVLLCAWEAEGRRQRLVALGGGLLAGALLVAITHGFIGSWTEARDQYDSVYKPIYREVPLQEALSELSLEPLIREADRYTFGALEPFVSNSVALAAGVLAALLLVLRTLGAPRMPLLLAGALGLLGIVLAIALPEFPYAPLRGLIGVLIVAAAAAGLFLCLRGLTRRLPYPREAVPALLLASILVGYGLLLGYKGPPYLAFALPFAAASLVGALKLLAPPRWETALPVAGLCAGALAAGVHLVDHIGEVEADAAQSERVAEAADELVADDETLMGDWVYWWLLRDERFGFNSAVWQQRWDNPDYTFREAFAAVCPDWVLLDTFWLDRYRLIETGRRFYPNQAPARPRERLQLRRILRDEYRPVRRMEAGGRKLTFWERRATGC